MMQPILQFVAIPTDDGCAIMQFSVIDSEGNVREPTDENLKREIQRAGLPIDTGWARVSLEDIPSTRENRNAWKLVDGKVVVVK